MSAKTAYSGNRMTEKIEQLMEAQIEHQQHVQDAVRGLAEEQMAFKRKVRMLGAGVGIVLLVGLLYVMFVDPSAAPMMSVGALLLIGAGGLAYLLLKNAPR